MATVETVLGPVDAAKLGVTLSFLNTVAMPALRKDGIPQETIDLMLRDVPRRFLTGERT